MNYAMDVKPFEPSRAHEEDAGIDLCSIEKVTIPTSERRTIRTGVHVELPEGTFGAVVPRSGLAMKHGITILNTPGIVDSNYRGEIMVTVYNSSIDTDYTIEPGDRIAQLIVCPYVKVELNKIELSDLTDTDRGQEGFGSTGA